MSKLIVSLVNEEQDFQRALAEDAKLAAARAGMPVEIIYAKNNGALQVEQLYRYVRAPEGQRPAAILALTVSGEGLERLARDAAGAGIGWVVLSREVAYLESLGRAHPTLPIGSVTPDQSAIGRIQARQVLSLLPSGGNVLYVQGPAETAAAQLRLTQLQSGIEGAGINLTVVDGEWTEASGEKAAMSWLRLSKSQNHRIDLLAAQNDSMAVGARRALVARRPECAGVPVIGCDGLPDAGQRLVNSGDLKATVIVPMCTGPAVDLVATRLRGNGSPARVLLSPKPFPAVLSPA